MVEPIGLLIMFTLCGEPRGWVGFSEEQDLFLSGKKGRTKPPYNAVINDMMLHPLIGKAYIEARTEEEWKRECK
jgi:hypothetical protein